MNKAASQLGKLAAGVPKKFSASELAKRTARLKAAQKNRAKTQKMRDHYENVIAGGCIRPLGENQTQTQARRPALER